MDRHDASLLVDERIAAFRREVGVPAIAYGLVRDGVRVHVSGAGEVALDGGRPPGESDIFRIASMTKSFTAAAVLLLRDRGALRLDDPLVAHLPWAASLRPVDGAPEISLRDLLTMDAGFPTDDPWGDRHESTPVEAFDAMTAEGFSFARAPRTGFEYSNLGYALLGRVISVVSGVDYREFVTSEVLAPMGLHDTGFVGSDLPADRLVTGFARVDAGLVPEPVTGPGAFSPMGGLHSSVRDLARWVGAFALSWTGTPDHPLGRWSLREMQEPHRLVSTVVVPPKGEEPEQVVTTSYGFGLMSDDDLRLGRFVSHSGGYPGFGSHMRWHPATGWGIVVLGNLTYTPAVRVSDALLRTLVADELAASPPDPAAGLWPRTVEAMDVVESLLRSWDDDLADRELAFNVDLDRPRAERRAELARLRERIGPFTRATRPWESTSPAQVRWWLKGEHGTANAEVLLSPEPRPRIQHLRVTEGDEPPKP